MTAELDHRDAERLTGELEFGYGEFDKRRMFIIDESATEVILLAEISFWRPNPELVARFINFMKCTIAVGDQIQCHGDIWKILLVIERHKDKFTTALKHVVDFAPNYSNAGECHDCLSAQISNGSHYLKGARKCIDSFIGSATVE